VDASRQDWSAKLDQVQTLSASCAHNIDAASIAVVNGEKKPLDWLSKATNRLTAALLDPVVT